MLVRDVMTRRPVTVPVTGTVADALATAEKADVHHLLLTSKDEFAGVLCVCALRELDRTETLLSRLPHRIVAVQAESPVWIAQRRFDEQEVSCMPVFEGDDLVGVLTRGDLRRRANGELSQPRCSFCGETRHVRPHPLHRDLSTCLSCEDRGRGEVEFDEGVAH